MIAYQPASSSPSTIRQDAGSSASTCAANTSTPGPPRFSQPHGGQHRPPLRVKPFHRVPGMFGHRVDHVALDPHLGEEVRRLVLDECHGVDVQAAAQRLVPVDDSLEHAVQIARG